MVNPQPPPFTPISIEESGQRQFYHSHFWFLPIPHYCNSYTACACRRSEGIQEPRNYLIVRIIPPKKKSPKSICSFNQIFLLHFSTHLPSSLPCQSIPLGMLTVIEQFASGMD